MSATHFNAYAKHHSDIDQNSESMPLKEAIQSLRSTVKSSDGFVIYEQLPEVLRAAARVLLSTGEYSALQDPEGYTLVISPTKFYTHKIYSAISKIAGKKL